MSSQKLKFLILLVIEAGFITLHLALTEPKVGIDAANSWSALNEWHFWIGLMFGYYVMFYAYTLACTECGYKQIWRSPNCMDWRMPEDKCWHCRHNLNEK